MFEDKHTRAAVLKGGSNYTPFSSLMGARYDADCVSNMRTFSVARARLLLTTASSAGFDWGRQLSAVVVYRVFELLLPQHE